jgi:hypothetical protein
MGRKSEYVDSEWVTKVREAMSDNLASADRNAYYSLIYGNITEASDVFDQYQTEAMTRWARLYDMLYNSPESI